MVKNLRLSFSAFEAYQNCPFKFKKLYIERIREPSNKYAMYGTAFHELLDTLYSTEEFSSSKATSLWPTIFDKEANKKGYEHISKKDLQEQKNRGIKDIKVWFKMAEQERILHPCIEHEIKMEGNFKESVLAARVDLVLNIKGGIGIIDWKTGASDKKNLMQLALYAVLYTKKTGRKIDWLIPFYIKTKEIVYQPFDTNIIKRAGKYFGDLYKAIMEDKEFLPTTNKNCYFCSFSKNGVCPLYKRNIVEM